MEKVMDKDTLVGFTQRLVWYFYNTAPSEVFDAVYGENRSQAYKQEKLNNLIKNGALSFWANLDQEHQFKLISEILNKYPLNK
jgi:hypothetical protein